MSLTRRIAFTIVATILVAGGILFGSSFTVFGGGGTPAAFWQAVVWWLLTPWIAAVLGTWLTQTRRDISSIPAMVGAVLGIVMCLVMGFPLSQINAGFGVVGKLLLFLWLCTSFAAVLLSTYWRLVPKARMAMIGMALAAWSTIIFVIVQPSILGDPLSSQRQGNIIRAWLALLFITPWFVELLAIFRRDRAPKPAL